MRLSTQKKRLLKQMHLQAWMPEPLPLCHRLMDFSDKMQALHLYLLDLLCSFKSKTVVPTSKQEGPILSK